MKQQQIPQGYKLTELGVIPEDWDITTYGIVFNFLSTANNSRNDLTTNGNIGYIHYGDIHTKWNFLLNVNKIEIPYLKKNILVAASYIKDGDVIMADASEDYEGIGKSIEILGLKDKKIISGLHTFLLRDTNNIYANGFKAYLHSISSVKKSFDKLATGLKVYGLSKSALKSICIPIPPKEEQTAIANALSDIDTLINQLKKLIAKKQAIKTSTMQQLLTGKTRLPAFAYREDGSLKGTKQSELGEIPEDWEIYQVGDCCEILTGFPFPSEQYCKDGVRLLRGSNIKRGTIDWAENITEYWSEITAAVKQYELLEGDIVISMDGSLVGKSFSQIKCSDLPALLLQRVARVRSKVTNINYLKEWICSIFFTQYCDTVKTVTAIPHISPIDIKSFKLFIPKNNLEQTAIAAILSDMDKEIITLEKRLAKTELIKQGMMQELLTGKTRLI
ncbi:restriction endonuclease subunit S [Neisseria sp. Ec49-e6-T10]|uniref:restriction endonuclease subunit S n=1 Tax=Neisseria sp. Ec49-e6-T10 TaxID=3140744 RepID=UPI003EB758D4